MPIFSFVAPNAGMFVWARFYFRSSAKYEEFASIHKTTDPEHEFQQAIWQAMVDEKVLLTPGSYYTPWQGHDMVTTKARGAEAGIGHFRFAFSTPSKKDIETGIERMAKVLGRYWY